MDSEWSAKKGNEGNRDVAPIGFSLTPNRFSVIDHRCYHGIAWRRAMIDQALSKNSAVGGLGMVCKANDVKLHLCSGSLAKFQTQAQLPDRTREVSRRKFLLSLGVCGVSAVCFPEGLLQRPSAAPSARLIDVHHHFAPPFYLSAAREQFLAMGRGDELNGPLTQWTPEKSLAEMDRNGVEYAVLSLTTPAVWLGDVQASRKLARRCNEYAAEVAAKYTGRFGFFASIPLPDTEGSLQEAAYALQALKADGIGLLTSYGDKWPGDPFFAAVFDELNQRRAVVYFHPTAPLCCRSLIPGVGASAIEFPQDTTRAITSLLLSGSLSRLSDINFIFSHAGGTLPMVAARIADLATDPEFATKLPHGADYELKRLHYEIAFSANKPAIAALKNLVPLSQILFGSDFPFYSIGSTARGMQDVGLSASEQEVIGWQNAMKLLSRGDSSYLDRYKRKDALMQHCGTPR